MQAFLADKYELYQRSVQEPESDLAIIAGLFERRAGRPLRDLREDFSGTALLSTTWVGADPARRAWAIDLDPEPLAWAREHNLARLPAAAQGRLTLLQADVLEVRPPRVPPVDAILAMNYSYFAFRTRPSLRAYLAAAREGLAAGGGLVLEVVGGPEVQSGGTERTDHAGFSYYWDRGEFDPIRHEVRCAIHFGFPDGSYLEDAFVYEWRLWSIRELRELLEEAGYAASEVYWEGPGKDGEGDRIFVPRERAPAEMAWIAYVVGWR